MSNLKLRVAHLAPRTPLEVVSASPPLTGEYDIQKLQKEHIKGVLLDKVKDLEEAIKFLSDVYEGRRFSDSKVLRAFITSGTRPLHRLERGIFDVKSNIEDVLTCLDETELPKVYSHFCVADEPPPCDFDDFMGFMSGLELA